MSCGRGRSRPPECSAGRPHPMQDNCELACHRHGSFFGSNPFGERLPPALQGAWPRRSTEQNLGRLEQKAADHAVSAFRYSTGSIDLARLVTCRRHAEISRDRRRSPEPGGALNPSHVGQDHYRANARRRHELACRLVATGTLNNTSLQSR